MKNLNGLINLIFLVVVASLMVFINWRHGGTASVVKGLLAAGKLTLGFSVLLVFMFIIAGQAQILTERYLPLLKIWLSGGKGAVGSWLAGIIAPGGIATFPIVKDLWGKGINRETLVLYLITVNLLNWQALMFRLPLLGWTITAIVYSLGLIMTAMVLVVVLLLRI